MSALVKWSPDKGEILPAPGDRHTSLDLTTPEGQRTAYRSHVGADFQLSGLVGQMIHVRDYYAHHVCRVDEETGEEAPGLRAVFITDDGIRISTSSVTALRCLLAWASVCQRASPFDPPLTFKVASGKSSRGPGNYLWLDLPELPNGRTPPA